MANWITCVVRTLNPSTRFITFIGNRNFHHLFHLTRGPSQTPLRITYADYGYQEEGNKAVILICGPMNGTRYMHIAKDEIAKENKVRIIHPDRFGFGDSTEIGLNERVSVWLEVVPALLKHLNIEHVALVAQSGGTVYALNTLLYQRHLLHPTRPYVALGAPWVHQSHSGTIAMHLLKVFPDPVLNNLNSIAGWFNSNVLPITGFSENIIATSAASIGSLFNKKSIDTPEVTDPANEAASVFEEQLRPVFIEMAFKENMQGLGQEALLLLRRGNEYDWGSWVDYDRYVPMLASIEEALHRTPVSDDQKLLIDVFYAETDVMIGTSKGPKFFNDCWSEDKRGPNIDYHTETVVGADHDRILDLRFGAIQRVFSKVRSRCGE